MRNLIAFLLRYQGVLLFVLLEVLSVYLFLTTSSYQRAAFLNSANGYAGTVLARRQQVTDYFHLAEQNQALLAENSRLRQQLFPPDFSRREADSLPVRRDSLGRVVYRHLRPLPAGLLPRPLPAVPRPDSLLLGGVHLADHDAEYPLVPARVINNSLRSVDNYLTLNVGAADNVQPGLGVLGVEGIVGRVKAVSAHYATVTSVLHSKTAVAAMIKRDGTFGSVRWPGDDYQHVLLDYIPRQNRLLRGDTIVTSGYNAVYPEGVFIGTIESFVKEPDKNFWTVSVRLGTDFSRLTYVYVVHSRPHPERDTLFASSTAPDAPTVIAPGTAATPAGGKPAAGAATTAGGKPGAGARPGTVAGKPGATATGKPLSTAAGKPGTVVPATGKPGAAGTRPTLGSQSAPGAAVPAVTKPTAAPRPAATQAAPSPGSAPPAPTKPTSTATPPASEPATPATPNPANPQ